MIHDFVDDNLRRVHADLDRNRRDCGLQCAVRRAVGKSIQARVADRRRVSERAIGLHRYSAVCRLREDAHGERVVLRVRVICQNAARCEHGERRAHRRHVSITHARRRIVCGRDVDRHRGVEHRVADTVVHFIRERSRAVEIERRGENERAVRIQNHRAMRHRRSRHEDGRERAVFRVRIVRQHAGRYDRKRHIFSCRIRVVIRDRTPVDADAYGRIRRVQRAIRRPINKRRDARKRDRRYERKRAVRIQRQRARRAGADARDERRSRRRPVRVRVIAEHARSRDIQRHAHIRRVRIRNCHRSIVHICDIDRHRRRAGNRILRIASAVGKSGRARVVQRRSKGERTVRIQRQRTRSAGSDSRHQLRCKRIAFAIRIIRQNARAHRHREQRFFRRIIRIRNHDGRLIWPRNDRDARRCIRRKRRPIMRPIHKRIRSHVARRRCVRKCAVCIQRQRAVRDIRDERSGERVVFHIRIICQNARVHRLREAQPQIHREVRTGDCVLMNLHRNCICTLHQKARWERVARRQSRLLAVDWRDRIKRRVHHHARRRVDPIAVDINHPAIVINERNFDTRNEVDIGDIHHFSEIRGEIFVRRIRSKTNSGHLIRVAIAKLGRARRPRRIIKAHIPPRRALVRAIV